MHWNATLYDREHRFVSEYGESLTAGLDPRPGEKLLDLGCGTGDLAWQLCQKGYEVTGLDASAEMIAGARVKYTGVNFIVGDARHFELKEKFEVVFSNAALHWIRDQDAVLDRVAAHLKPGGCFVAELGAKGNVEKIITAIKEVLTRHGYEKLALRDNWYFPSVGEYAVRLEEHGFRIRSIEAYDRPTVLKNTENGIVEWLEMFAATYFEGIEAGRKGALLYEIQDQLQKELYREGKWVADYRRLRFWSVAPATDNR